MIIARNLIFTFALTFLFLESQGQIFDDIAKFNGKSEKPAVLYFHFKGCPPCKQMDDITFKNDTLVNCLKSNYALYEIYGFEQLQKQYRTTYQVFSDPSILFLNKDGDEIHRIVGYYSPEDLCKEISISTTKENIRTKDSLYNLNCDNISFLNEYMWIKDKLGQVDSALIYNYLRNINYQSLSDEKNLRNVIHFGYYKGRRYFNYNSAIYRLLDRFLKENPKSRYANPIRNRLLLCLIENAYQEPAHILKEQLIKEIEQLEFGQVIRIQDMTADSTLRAISAFAYPSFELRYEMSTDKHDLVKQESVLLGHIKFIQNDAARLNEIAWRIYEGEYPVLTTEKGLELIKRCIKIEQKYVYVDTYAALLYKNGALQEAKQQAVLAIELAKIENVPFDETNLLLNKINQALNN
jgi:thioredoxin-related protein